MNETSRKASAASAAGLSEAVLKAEQNDAAGNHKAAVDHLAAGARHRDVEALTRLSKRLLVGDRAPLLPNDGARLLEQAAGLGGAEAAAVLAVLYAVGASKRHGLAQALEKLTLAAERGWGPARAQLELLADEAAPGPTSPGAGAARSGNWRALAERVDLSTWQRALPGTDLHETPHIRVIPDIASEAVCRWLVEKARGRLTRALVYEALSKKTVARESRTNTAATLNLLSSDVVTVLVQMRMAACLGLPFRQFEPISVLHYDEGEEITEHFDFVDPNVPDYETEIASKGQRVVTFLIYLNDDYGGGETEFPELGLSHRGRRGEGLYFVNALDNGDADVRTLHAGRPPLRGEKWVVSQFVRSRPTL